MISKKRYGQNFLNSDEIAQKISKIICVENNNVLEIGPGKLALTKHIIQNKPKKFIAIDIDKKIIEEIKKNKNLINYFLNEDALRFDEISFFNQKPFIIISNLPFNISTKLLIKWVKLQHKFKIIDAMVLMFQKELGERILASKNKKKYGRLGILAQSVFDITRIMHVGKENFDPVPKVDTIVLKFIPSKKIYPINFNKLEKITNFFFNSRRKKNEKKIKKIFTPQQIQNNNLDKLYDLRAENISKEIFYKMSNLF